MRGVVFVALALTGCAAPPAQEFAACFAGGPAATAVVGGAFTGTVLAAEVGEPPEGCFDGETVLGPAYDFDRSTAVWARLADELAQEWVVGLWFPHGPAPLAVDVVIDVTLAFEFGGFSASTGNVALVREVGVYAYVGSAPTLAGLAPPEERAITRGGVAGSTRSSCGKVKYYDLAVDGAPVPYGARVHLGDVEVRHGGFTEGAYDRGQCLDWAPDFVAVAILGE